MGYDVAGMTTQSPNQAHLATIYYDRVALTRLTPQFRFYSIATKRTVPRNSGKTVQMYRRNIPSYNGVPAAEGVIPAPYSNGTAVITATVEHYADFMSSSTLLELTDIAPTPEGMIGDLTIRAAGTVDTIVRQEIDSNTGSQVATIGTNLAANDFKKAVALLLGANVAPHTNGRFMGVIHPYNVYDLIVDNTVGGFIDALKYQNGQKVLDGEVGEIAMVRLLTSTNVGTDGVAAPNTKYFVYVIGDEAIGVVDLAGTGPSNVTDPQKERFSVNVIKGGPGPSDPTGEIGTYVSYSFNFTAKTFDAARIKVIKADSSII